MPFLSTQPAFKLSLLFIAGILIAPLVQCPFWVLLGSLGLMILFVVVFMSGKHPQPSQLYIALAILLMGAARFLMTADSGHPNHVNQHLENSNTLIEGMLIKDPALKANKIEYRVDVRYICIHDSTFSAYGRVSIPDYESDSTDLKYGDIVVASGVLEKPKGQRNPGGFDYRAYLKTRGIDAQFRLDKHHPIQSTGASEGSLILKHAIYPARRWIAATISGQYSGQSEALLKALIIGDRTDLTHEMRETFARVGIIHVLAVSGLHVGFILLLITGLLKLFRLPGLLKTCLTIIGLLFFMLLTEANAPVVRATIMASLYLIGKQLDRDVDVYNIVGLAAFIILMMQPRFLFDVGFQLSFSAVLSIIYLYRRLDAFFWVKSVNRKVRRIKPIRYLWGLFLVSISAQLGTVMITAFHFNRVSVSGIFANLFAIPLIGLIIPMEIVRLLLRPLIPSLAAFIALVNELLISLLFYFSEIISTASWTAFYVPTPHLLTMAAFLAGIVLLFNLSQKRLVKPLFFVVLILLNGMVWREVSLHRSGSMTYVQLDVGQGDAAVIHLPRNKTVLVDGGPVYPTFDAGERIVAPYLRHRGVRTLDAVILTHEHGDHVGGLPYILDHFNIGEFVLSDSSSDSTLFRACMDIAYRKKIPVRLMCAPDSLILSNAKFYFISPDSLIYTDEKPNNESIVTMLCFGKRRLLLTGDAEIPVENHLMCAIHSLKADVVKGGHHGSKTSSSEKFLRQVDPDEAILSVGARNRFRHPSLIIIERLDSLGIEIHRTDQEGAVIRKSDGIDLVRIKWQKKRI